MSKGRNTVLQFYAQNEFMWNETLATGLKIVSAGGPMTEKAIKIKRDLAERTFNK